MISTEYLFYTKRFREKYCKPDKGSKLEERSPYRCFLCSYITTIQRNCWYRCTIYCFSPRNIILPSDRGLFRDVATNEYEILQNQVAPPVITILKLIPY